MPGKNSVFLAILILFASACGAPLKQAEPTQTALPTLTPTPTKLPLSEAEVLRTTVEEARAARDSGTALIMDVRGPSAFEVSHIAGAVSISLGEIESHPTSLNLDKDLWIITYCT